MALYRISILPLMATNIGAAISYQTREPLTIRGERFRPSKADTDRQADGIVLPIGSSVDFIDREQLWNCAAEAEMVTKRGPRQGELRRRAVGGWTANAALPHELTDRQREILVADFAQRLADRHGVAVDWCIHAPSTDSPLNHHVHLAWTSRRIIGQIMGEKAREFSDRNRGRNLVALRRLWEAVQNEHLARAKIEVRVDCRTLQAQGIGRRASRHRGAGQTAIMRKRPAQSWAATMMPHELHDMRQDARATVLALARCVRLADNQASRLAAWKTLVDNCRDAVKMGLAKGDALDLAKWAQRTEASACPKTTSTACHAGKRLGQRVGRLLAEAAKPIGSDDNRKRNDDPADELDPILTALVAAGGAVRHRLRQRDR
jgi:hypothetical protein